MGGQSDLVTRTIFRKRKVLLHSVIDVSWKHIKKVTKCPFGSILMTTLKNVNATILTGHLSTSGPSFMSEIQKIISCIVFVLKELTDNQEGGYK